MAISVSNLSFTVYPGLKNNIRTRTQSSLYAKGAKSERVKRPKSSPIKLALDGIDTFYLTQRNQTAPTYVQSLRGDRHSCKRLEQVDSESVKQYKFPSTTERRPLSTVYAPRKAPEERQKLYNIGPGYTIVRNNSEFTVKIDSEEFFGPRKKAERERSTEKSIQDHKDIMISELHEQILSLSVALEEEKMNHNESKTTWQQLLESTRTTIIKNYEDNTDEMKENHNNLIKDLQDKHDKELRNQKELLNQKMNNSIQELNTYKASFESFRQSLIKETEGKIENQKNILKEKFDENLRNKLEKQKSFLIANFEVDLERSKEERKTELDLIISKHKSEIEVLNRKFSDVSALEDKLSQSMQELARKKRDLEKSQDEYNNLYEMYSSVRKEMTIVRNDNENLKSELQEFSDRFEERVRRVDDDYKQRMDSLQNQIVEIRRAYMIKCDELVQERKNADTQLHGRIETAKDVMKELIHTRERARISLISLDTDEDFVATRRQSDNHSFLLGLDSLQASQSSVKNLKTFRPSSAPTTEKDDSTAKHNIFLINRDKM